MIKITVPDMHCEKCVERISKGLSFKNIKFNIDLKTKTVLVEKENYEIAKEELDDLGFTVE